MAEPGDAPEPEAAPEPAAAAGPEPAAAVAPEPAPKPQESEVERRIRWRREYDEEGVRTRKRAPYLLAAFLVLVVGLFVAAYVVDHQRQASPTGAVKTWLNAGAAGDCERYLALETPDAKAADLAAGAPNGFEAVPTSVTSPSEIVCRTLVQRFGKLTVTGVTELVSASADSEVVQVATAAGTTSVAVVKQDGKWKVDDASLRTCAISITDTIPVLPTCVTQTK